MCWWGKIVAGDSPSESNCKGRRSILSSQNMVVAHVWLFSKRVRAYEVLGASKIVLTQLALSASVKGSAAACQIVRRLSGVGVLSLSSLSAAVLLLPLPPTSKLEAVTNVIGWRRVAKSEP